MSSHVLEFAGIAPVVVPILAVEQHLAEKLHEAVSLIFDRRHPRHPRSLEAPPPDWARPWETLVTQLPARRELRAGFDAAAALWDPVLAGRADGMVWNPVAATWQPSADGG